MAAENGGTGVGLPFWRSGGCGDGGGGGLLMAVRLSGWHSIFEFGIGVPKRMRGRKLTMGMQLNVIVSAYAFLLVCADLRTTGFLAYH